MEMKTDAACQCEPTTEDKLQLGLHMLKVASDEQSLLDSVKQLRLFVSEPQMLLKNGTTFFIDVDINCKEYTALLQKGIDVEMHKKVSDVIKPYLTRNANTLNKTQTSILVEGLWVLTNIASGKTYQTRVIAETNIAPLAMQVIMEAENMELVDQATMLISNIIADDEVTTQIEINGKFIRHVLYLLEKVRVRNGENNSATKCGTCKFCVEGGTCKSCVESEVHVLYVFTSIFKANRLVSDDCFERIVLTCCTLLNDDVIEVQHELLEVLCKASDGSRNFIDIIIKFGYVQQIVSFINHKCAEIKRRAIYIVGILMLGSDELTWKIIRSNLFVHLPLLMYSSKDSVTKVLWILSNIVAGDTSMLDCMFDFDLWPYIVYNLKSTEGTVVYECVWVVANFMDNASKEQRMKLLSFDKYGVLSALLPLISTKVVNLTAKEADKRRIVDLVMEFLSMLLRFVEHYIDGDYSNIKTVLVEKKENHELFAVVEHLKSKELKDNLAKMDEHDYWNTSIGENRDNLERILSAIENCYDDVESE